MLLGGIVALADGVCFDCGIRNLSETGAKISYAPDVHPPERFHLIMVRDRHVCEVQRIWIKGNECGVEFKARIPLSEITDPALSHLTHMWLAKAGR